jgi:hypothetical protein
VRAATLLRRSRLEALLLHRVVRVWVPLFLLVWVVALRAQEPPFLRRAGIPFFWGSLEAALLLMACILPAVWILSHGRDAYEWTLRGSRSPAGNVLSNWLGLFGYGLILAVVMLGTGIAIGLLYGDPMGWRAPALILLEAALLSAPLCAVAPALSYLGLTPVGLMMGWLLLLGLSMARGFPVPTGALLPLERDAAGTIGAAEWGPALAATLAGLLLSVALAKRRLRP